LPNCALAAAGARTLAASLAYASITAFLARVSLRTLRPLRVSGATRPSVAGDRRRCHEGASLHSLRRIVGVALSITFI
jgi:hypothetical protein